MDHFSHEHPLILNEDYFARGGDECDACNEEIVSCKSFVYSCSRSIIMGIPSPNGCDKCKKFLLHKTCGELPRRIENPRNPKEFLVLHINPDKRKILDKLYPFFESTDPYCDMCSLERPWNYCSDSFEFFVCLKCAMSQIEYSLINHKFKHAAHSQHPLALIQRPSSFKCDACNVKNNTEDMSYKCIDCAFWMHKSCADAPTSFPFHFHKKHPLVLSFSLPEAYQNFTQYCKLCHGRLGLLSWLYYCPQCRFFAHFGCAKSSRMSSSSENELYPDLVHLPPANESSINLLFEQFIKDTSTLENNEEFSRKSRIKDWAHGEHQLQLITTDELNDQKDSDDKLLICDGCAKPIRHDGDSFYACVPCRYFLHKFCGELPRTIDHAFKYKTEPCKLFYCYLCNYPGNCISLYASRRLSLPSHIGCLMLPKMIKHESHRHPLYSKSGYSESCKACGYPFQVLHSCECEGCDFRICSGCIMKARTVEHRWDPHPLHLIYDPEMVMNHVHGFHCEYCSVELDTNYWFYHCNICDLSFHLRCYDRICYLNYSHIKFGATNIIKDKLHSHSLKFVLNKKFCHCGKCNKGIIGEPVLECAPCKTMFCWYCF